MYIGKAVGSIVSTRKDDALVGKKLLIIQPVDVNLNPMGHCEIAVDSVGAGAGEVVLVSTGSSANKVFADENSPIDRVVVGIIDAVEVR